MCVTRDRWLPRAAVLALLRWAGALSARGADAQAPVPTATEVLALNRAGRWDEAAASASRRLADRTPPAEERCTLLESAGYAFVRLGRARDAAAALDAFDRQCAQAAVEAGVRAEAARLRAELASGPHRAPAPPYPALDLANLPRAGSLSRARGTPTPPRALLSNADGFWRIEPTEIVGAELFLQLHNDLCARTGADACLVVRRGRIVSEWYRAGVPDSLAAMSSTKSVTGLLAMSLLAGGKLRSLDEPVCRFVGSWCDPARQGATVRHLLTMTSGLPSMTQAPAVGTADDMNAFVAQLRPAAAPGTRWAYSNEGVQLLSPVLDRAAGEPVQRYAERRLFGPLGMRDTRFHADAAGHAATYANLLTTPRDLARVGLLVLQRGRWRGRQLVPAALVDSLVRPSQALNPRYGMLWWRLAAEGRVAYVTRGYLETNMYVFPAHDVVVVRMQNRPLSGDPHASYEPAALPLFRAMLRAFAPAHWH